ncbi:MAG: molybdenum cofactor guanylyltransferase [Asticcacaulis sp.]
MRTAGIILCGGKSSRMGQDKAGLMWQGQSWLDHTAQILRDAGADKIYVSGKREGYISLQDMIDGRGPLAAICSCALQIEDEVEALLFVPVDMPLLSAEALKTLSEGAEDVQAAVFADFSLPLLLRLDDEMRNRCRAALAQLTAGGKGAVKEFLTGIRVNRLSVIHPETLRNFNRPEDLNGIVYE